MKLQRHPQNPVLLPNPASDWETYNVFNPSVIHHNGLFHMHYRAQGMDWISRIGYAVSKDGIQWNRLRLPVLEPHDVSDARGVEDPRVTEIEGRFYMCYTAYSREVPGDVKVSHMGGGVTPMIAVSDNLITWERLGSIVRGEDNKDHVLFPRRINGRYVALHRRPPQVWMAESDDLIHWHEENMRPTFGPRPDNIWDEKRVGGNGVPIETEHGWLMLYHAYNDDHVYRLGVCLLDLDNPAHMIHRPKDFIFEPQELWELRGDVPNVVFSCANPVVNGTVYVYYGGADHVIGLATCTLTDLLNFARHG
jgi:beta-1,2-mannobiose phosphorylase / 1,2-beta-oligomannan phosphorylase